MHRQLRYLLIIALVYGVALRFYAISQWKQGLSHDESVSYLCASATEGMYQERIPTYMDTLIQAATIQVLYQRPAQLALTTVASDLVRYDIHPPLYFWALHAQHTFVGSGINGGLWLNAFAGLFILGCTYLMARHTLGTANLALVACAVWYLSPAVVQIDLEARQYQFMAACAMASYLLVIRSGQSGMSSMELIGFTVINTLGLLSHYYYSFLLVPGISIVLLRHGFRKPLLILLSSLIASYALFLLLFPEFLEFIKAYEDRAKDPEAERILMDKMKTIVYATLAFFTHAHLLRYIFLLLCLAGSTAVLIRYGRAGMSTFTRASSPSKEVALLLTWCALFTTGLYLLGVSPPHAVGEQYFAYFWPLLAIVLVHVARLLLPARYRLWILTAYMLQLGYAFTTSVRGSEYLKPVLPAGWYATLKDSDVLVVDDVKRSFLPRAMRDMPGGTPLFLMKEGRPSVNASTAVSYVHLDVENRPTAAAFTTWMTAQGFTHGEVRVHKHHELHTYTR
ncbi:MAG: glycosyltransferase family 39 protein [Flavobacteriales bacterium]|nr:glycosyltransferase family 39 protein [Flavobacteriales bacterium]